MASNVRHTVAWEATGPNRAGWWRNPARSEIVSPPSASITATSTSTWPRSWPPAALLGRRHRRRQRRTQPSPVGQITQQAGAGVIHHPSGAGGHVQAGTAATFHLGDALLERRRQASQPPVSATTRAFPRIHPPPTR